MGADHRGTRKLPASRGSDTATLEAVEEADDTENGLAIAHALKPRAAKRAKGSSTSSDGKQSKNTRAARPRTPAPESEEDAEDKSGDEEGNKEEEGPPMEIEMPIQMQPPTDVRPSSIRKRLLAIKMARLPLTPPPPAGASSSSSSSSGVTQPVVGPMGLLPIRPRGATPPMDGEDRAMLRKKAEAMLESYVLLCDGDYGHTNFFMNTETPCTEISAKTHGGASMTQQPADTGRGHAILRKMIHSSEFHYEDNHSDPTGNAWKELNGVLNAHLPPALFRNVWKALCHLSVKASKAFSPSTVQSGFDTSGLITYKGMREWAEPPGEGGGKAHFSDYTKILSVNPHFRDLGP